ncbi:hypothetical protein AYI68_g2557 [Smittium mucronatum]|uniref:Uncharacterized protein n=1 Tax=Smittium mucronatum TaxID=133383 RepID=A0A1R0H2E3_9FUNG|nr:hypothetical protein AYI68_g2556 [Smittium mucronatum]OLY83308.1 hypothetical protein AYI68_g2557 [Smittium mucronatum]
MAIVNKNGVACGYSVMNFRDPHIVVTGMLEKAITTYQGKPRMIFYSICNWPDGDHWIKFTIDSSVEKVRATLQHPESSIVHRDYNSIELLSDG